MRRGGQSRAEEQGRVGRQRAWKLPMRTAALNSPPHSCYRDFNNNGTSQW